MPTTKQVFPNIQQGWRRYFKHVFILLWKLVIHLSLSSLPKLRELSWPTSLGPMVFSHFVPATEDPCVPFLRLLKFLSQLCFINLTQPRVMWDEKLQLRNPTEKTSLYPCLWLSWLMVDVGGVQPTVGGTIPRQVGMKSIRKLVPCGHSVLCQQHKIN